jgi:hypothetical protein
MAVIKSGASTDQLTIDPTSKAARVIQYTSTGREVSPHSKTTYMASGTFTPAATPTDLIYIEGSSTKTVRIISFTIATTNTAAGSQQFFLIKRSTANTGGTFVSATAVPLDSTDAASTVNRVGHWTANPAALGTSIGTLSTKRVASPVATPASFAGVVVDADVDMLSALNRPFLQKSVVLNGVAQCLAINFNGASLVAGQTHAYTIMWTEE